MTKGEGKKTSNGFIGIIVTLFSAMVSKERFPQIRDMLFVGGRLGTMVAIGGFTWLGMKKISKRYIYKRIPFRIF